MEEIKFQSGELNVEYLQKILINLKLKRGNQEDSINLEPNTVSVFIVVGDIEEKKIIQREQLPETLSQMRDVT